MLIGGLCMLLHNDVRHWLVPSGAKVRHTTPAAVSFRPA